jgi:aspartyl protease family protein
MIKLWIVGAIILLNTSLAWSKDLSVVVVGLFRNQAVVEINHEQRLLKVGKTSPEGVTLISANSKKAVLEIDGVKRTYQLGEHISSSFSSTTAQAEVNLWPTNGMYLTAGIVNGYTVDFVVDTGASAIALNAETATRVGLDYLNAKKIQIKTASGTEIGYEVKLNSVQIGDITLNDVRAMVIDGKEPQRALLGMTFLNQLEMNRSDRKLNLKQKY